MTDALIGEQAGQRTEGGAALPFDWMVPWTGQNGRSAGNIERDSCGDDR
jgi:hypothetical protein